MTNKQILQKAIDKAVKNGWIPKIQWKMNPELYRSAIIFSHDFAKAMGFKLKDLGQWCDEGKEPLKFIERLLD